MKIRRAIKIYIAVALIWFCAAQVPARAQVPGDKGAIAYLDYTLSSPYAVYADEDIVVVAGASGMTFFCDGNIYEKPYLSAQKQIARSGGYIYYVYNNLLSRVDLSGFSTERVLSGGEMIGASAFSVRGNKLIAMTSNGAIRYENLAETPLGYDFAGNFGSGEVCITENGDIYSVNGKIYRNGVYLCEGKAVYMAEINGTAYFSNDGGIYRISNGDTECVLQRESVYGICAYGSELLFIDGATGKIMQMASNGENLREFRFDVSIDLGGNLSFSLEPETVTVSEGTPVHRGTVEGSTFTLTGTEISDASRDYVKLGEVGEENRYAVLFSENGYALSPVSGTVKKEQNVPITFEKGHILHSCAAYKTCVAQNSAEAFALEKGEEISIVSAYETNGHNYYLFERAGGERGFVLSGEVKESLASDIPDNVSRTHAYAGKDNTIEALVIILLSTALLALALFFILAKKENIKI